RIAVSVLPYRTVPDTRPAAREIRGVDHIPASLCREPDGPLSPGGYESGPRPLPAGVTRRSAAIWCMASSWLPAVPAAPRAARARAGEEEAQQPQDENDQGDPPQHVDRK